MIDRVTWPAVLYAVLRLTVVKDAPGFSVPDRHANECRGQAFHRLVRPARTDHNRFCRPGSRREAAGNDTIMLAAGWTVLVSVIAHGATANPLVKRMAGRSLAETEEGARATR
jgi:hypothetical protein